MCSVNSPGNQNPVTLHDINGQILSLQRSYTDLYRLRLCLSCCVSGYYSLPAYTKTVRSKINKKDRDKTDKLDRLDNKKKNDVISKLCLDARLYKVGET